MTHEEATRHPSQQASTDPILAAADVTRSFPGPRKEPTVPVLRGVSLKVARSEMVSIVGPSGSGKSTLLYNLSGLDTPTSGSVTVTGRDLTRLSRSAVASIRRQHIGFVFQSYNLVPSLNARENVSLPARLMGRPISRAQANHALAQVGIGDRGTYKPSELSGGQQQRVAIARVLALRPTIVFADEPTGALDTASGAEVLRLLRGLTTDGSSVVLVTHDLEAAALADRVFVLRDGSIHSELKEPTPEGVLDAMARARGDS